ncbi:MAG: hypothetical protein OJF59_001877 [Cytophagales bacterium]|nr:MAG: hypothetical protein OJF59_001877 [Cytophagales bacterium]
MIQSLIKEIVDNHVLMLLFVLSLIGLNEVFAQDMENPYQVRLSLSVALMPDNVSYLSIDDDRGGSDKLKKRYLENGAVEDEYFPDTTPFGPNSISTMAVSPDGVFAAICRFEPVNGYAYATEIVIFNLKTKKNHETVILKGLKIPDIKSISFNASSDLIFFSTEFQDYSKPQSGVVPTEFKNYSYRLKSGNVRHLSILDNYKRIACTADSRIVLTLIEDKSLYLFSLRDETVKKINSLDGINLGYFANSFKETEAIKLFPVFNFGYFKSKVKTEEYGEYFFGKDNILYHDQGIVICDYGSKIRNSDYKNIHVNESKEVSVRLKFAEKYPEQYPLKGIHLNSSFLVTSKQGMITEFKDDESAEKQFSLNTIAKVGDRRIELVPVEFPNSKSYLSKRYCNAIEKMFTSEPAYTHYFLGKSSYDGRHYFVFNDMTFGFKSKSNSIISIRDMLEIDRDESLNDFSIDAVRRLANDNILIIARINNPYQTYSLFLNESDKASGKFISDNKAWVSSLMKFVILTPNGESIISKKSFLLYPLSYMVDETGFYIVTNSIAKPVEFKIENSSSLLAIGKQINTIEGGGIAVRNKNGGVAVTKFSNDLKILWHKVVEEWNDYNVETDLFGSSFVMGDKVYVHTINYKNYITNKPYQMLASIDKTNPTIIEKSFGKESNFIMLLNSIDNKPIRINYDFRHESRDNFIPNLVGADLFKERIQYVELSELFPKK